MIKLIFTTSCFAFLLSSHTSLYPNNPIGVHHSYEIESLSKILAIKKKNAQTALENLKAFLNTDKPLHFEKMQGGYNSPTLVFQFEGDQKAPLGVLKFEEDPSAAQKRMQILDEMQLHDCKLIPQVLRSKRGEYLVDLGGKSYSCIEYLVTDEKPPLSFEQILQLTSQFHTHSKNTHLTEAHYRKTLDYFSSASFFISHLDPQLMQWDASIFSAPSWHNCVRCAQYLSSPSFRKIYDCLPMQLIHGDIDSKNIIFSSGSFFFIDFETMRMDIRLRDFATFCGGTFLDTFLLLLEEGNLLSCIQSNYGELESAEKEYLPFIVLLERSTVLGWVLHMLSQSLSEQDIQKTQKFRKMLINTIQEIDKICQVPLIYELLLAPLKKDQITMTGIL